MLAALTLLFLGARIGLWLAWQVGFDSALAWAWPYLRWLAVVLFTTVSVEVLYFVAPNVKHKFVHQTPGAVVAVILWLASSFGLRLYLHNFSQFTSVYGTLGAMIVLMLWFYFGSLAILVGAEINAQLAVTRSTTLTSEGVRPLRRII